MSKHDVQNIEEKQQSCESVRFLQSLVALMCQVSAWQSAIQLLESGKLGKSFSGHATLSQDALSYYGKVSCRQRVPPKAEEHDLLNNSSLKMARKHLLKLSASYFAGSKVVFHIWQFTFVLGKKVHFFKRNGKFHSPIEGRNSNSEQ